MSNQKITTIVTRSLKIKQNENHHLYMFTLPAYQVLEIAEISRVTRDHNDKLIGYQRPKVKKHVKEIIEYLDSGNVIFPNSLILSLSSTVRFRESRGPKIGNEGTVSGTIEIPVPSKNQIKPAWIVDGQQRALALQHIKNKDLPIPINAFISDDVETQRDQFLRVNNTKPLPRGLITELLPQVSTILPARLATRQAPSALCDILNTDTSSPFKNLIRRTSTPPEKKKIAVITDTAIIKMIEESLTNPNGCLFPYRNIATGETDFNGVQKVLISFWSIIKEVFPDAWGLPPQKSRLTHSVGLRAMGCLMDRSMSGVDSTNKEQMKQVKADIQSISGKCSWTSGEWSELGNLKWNELQNIPLHLRLLTNYLIRIYLEERAKK